MLFMAYFIDLFVVNFIYVPKLEIRKNFFSHRVIDLWNALPYDVKHAKNTVQFKQLYDKIIENGVAADFTSDL